MNNQIVQSVNLLLEKRYTVENKNKFVNEIKKDISINSQILRDNHLYLLYAHLKINRDLINRISKNDEIEKDRLSKSKSLFATKGLEIPKKYLEENKYGI